MTMTTTWDEILKHSLSVKEHGKPYNIPVQELDEAVPEAFAEKGMDSSLDALNRTLAPHGLVAIMTLGVYVQVDIKPD